MKSKVIDAIRYDGLEFLNEKVYNDSFYKFLYVIDNENRINKLIDSIKNKAEFEIKYVGEDKFTDVEKFTFSTLSRDKRMRKFSEGDSLNLRSKTTGEKFFLDIEIVAN